MDRRAIGTQRKIDPMRLGFLARVFLVALQIAIGWHLFYEGVWKLRNPSWTSKGYVRNATGPFALPIRWTAGDPDVSRTGLGFSEADPTPGLLERLTPLPPESGQDEDAGHQHRYLPEPLKKQWESYYEEQFLPHYQLGKEENLVEREKVHRKLIDFENDAVKWLKSGVKKVKRKGVSGPDAEIPMTTPERVQEYQSAREEVEQAKREESFFAYGTTARLKAAKETEAALRKELQDDLDTQYADLKKALREELTWEQKRMALPAELPVAAGWANLAWIDATVKWGLTIVGALLIVGLLTRLASVAGSLYMLAFYLAMPAVPGSEVLGSPSHFLIINGNIIEILALLAIATSQPGRRYGIDLLLRTLWPFGKRSETESVVVRPVAASHGRARAETVGYRTGDGR
jgi:uncharacterized membrane protein YphA (DoxX/SURF4 family)